MNDAIRIVVLDVDGVLTSGHLFYSEQGEVVKAFDSKDGLGIKRLIEAGIDVAVISGRDSAALRTRLGDLGVRCVRLGVSNKAEALLSVLEETGRSAAELLAVGDDLPDLPMLKAAKISACPADAHPDVRDAVDWIVREKGGRGAVRLISDSLLAAKDWANAAFRVVIPSRFASSRLPGKPLIDIAGKPMILHVVDRAIAAGAREVLVATDDERIARCVADAGHEAVMTRPDHESGTDRIAEVCQQRGFAATDIVVNLQGDEPAMPSECISLVAQALASRPSHAISTLATPITSAETLLDRNAVKVVLRDQNASGSDALLFSRAAVPFARDHSTKSSQGLPTGIRFLRHLGIYGYRVGDLLAISGHKPTALEQTEKLEQLRALAMGLKIHVGVIDSAPPDGVDTENDLRRIEKFLASS